MKIAQLIHDHLGKVSLLHHDQSNCRFCFRVSFYADAKQSALEIRSNFFAFFLVVANWNASCYWLQIIRLLPISKLLLCFYPDWRLVLSKHGRLHLVRVETASRITQTVLSRNVRKFMRDKLRVCWTRSKAIFFLLKVDLLSTIRNKKLITQGEKLETSAKFGKTSTKFGYCNLNAVHVTKIQNQRGHALSLTLEANY